MSWTPARRVLCCKAVAALWYDLDDDAKAILDPIAPARKWTWRESDGLRPPFLTCGWGGERHLVCCGTQTAAQGASQFLSFVEPLAGLYGFDVIEQYRDAAHALLRILKDVAAPQEDVWNVFGHSLGGVVVELACIIDSVTHPNRKYNLYTIGAPAGASPKIGALCDNITYLRYQNYLDFVPTLVPNKITSPNLYSLGTDRLKARWDLIDHWNPAVVLYESRPAADTPHSLGTVGVEVKDVLAWGVGRPTEYGAEHLATIYARRLVRTYSGPVPNQIPPDVPVEILHRIAG